MKYVFLVYEEEAAADEPRTCRCDAFVEEALDYQQQLRQSGHLLSASAPISTDSALTLRARRGEVSLADGSGAAPAGRLVELCLIEARDLNEAIRLAGRMPEARLGRVEVWALQDERGS